MGSILRYRAVVRRRIVLGFALGFSNVHHVFGVQQETCFDGRDKGFRWVNGERIRLGRCLSLNGLRSETGASRGLPFQADRVTLNPSVFRLGGTRSGGPGAVKAARQRAPAKRQAERLDRCRAEAHNSSSDGNRGAPPPALPSAELPPGYGPANRPMVWKAKFEA